tara:strand:+ start:220 stop:441 length:222 start_codon:yes stop_codon:yes gene_type:complete
MNYQIGDLLLGKHGGKIFMIKKVIQVKRALHNGVYLEDMIGYRIAPTDNLGYAFVVAHDELHERFEPFTMDEK